jgi:hypothetical protein
VVAPPLRRLIRALRWALITLVGLFTAYALFGWIGSAIPRNGDWSEPDANDSGAVEIMVETNGVHTALVLPLVTPERDWRPIFPASDVGNPGRPYTHVSVSWGEREVFLDTPTWWDLSPITVLRIIGIGGDGMLHIAHYVRPAPAVAAAHQLPRLFPLRRVLRSARPLHDDPDLQPVDQRHPRRGRREDRLVDPVRRRGDEMGPGAAGVTAAENHAW